MQQYNGDKKLIFNEIMMMSALYSTNTFSSQKQQSAHRHVAPLGHIIMIPIQPVFVFSS
jgi:hypothetical protein